jgi:hypothetical protein
MEQTPWSIALYPVIEIAQGMWSIDEFPLKKCNKTTPAFVAYNVTS